MTPDEILHGVLDDCAERNIATDGDKLLKALNDNGYAVIAAAELTALRAELADATERADHAEGFCYRAAMAADKDGFVCAEAVALRAELAKVTGERDRLKVNFNLESNQFHDNQWRQLTEMAAERDAAREALAKAVEERDSLLECQLWKADGYYGWRISQLSERAAIIRARKEPTL